MLAKPNMAIMTIYSPNFYTKKTGSYLHAMLRSYGIVKLMNKLLVFHIFIHFDTKKRKSQKHANTCIRRAKYMQVNEISIRATIPEGLAKIR